MSTCDCTFPYHSVIPPTHCPKCGRCLGCGMGAYPAPYPVPYPVPYPTPVYPQPYDTWPGYQPWKWAPTITCNTTNPQPVMS